MGQCHHVLRYGEAAHSWNDSGFCTECKCKALILRCFVRLSEEMSDVGEFAEGLFTDYMSLSVYRFVAALRHSQGNAKDWLTLEQAAANQLSGLLLSRMTQEFPQFREQQADSQKPLCFNTLIDHAELLVRDETVGMLRRT